MRTTTFLAAIAAFSLIPSILGSLYRRQSVTQPAQNTTAPAINPLVDPPFWFVSTHTSIQRFADISS